MINENTVREKIAELRQNKLVNEIEWTDTTGYGYEGDATEGLVTEMRYKLVGSSKFTTLHMNIDNLWVPVMTLRVPMEGGLKAIRQHAGLSQSELARLADVSVRTLQDYEQGKKPIGKAAADTVLRLAEALHCTVEELIR